MATKPILHTIPRITAQSLAQPAISGRAAGLSNLLSRAWIKNLLFLVGDVAALAASHHLAETLTRHSLHIPATFLNPSDYYLFYAPFFTAMLYLLGAYKSPDLRRPEKELEVLFKGVSFSFVALACANFVLFKSLGFSRYLLVVWYALALLFLLVARFSLRGIYGSLWRRGLARQKALLLGSPEHLAAFEQRLAIQRYSGYSIVGALDGWEKIAEAEGARLVILHLPESSAEGHPRVLEIFRRCQERGIELEVYSHLLGPAGLRFERDDFSGCFRLYSPPRWSRAAQRFVKSALDIAIGLAGSLAAVALIPIVALLVKWEDGGPIFFHREYVGTDGRVHRFLKFRTMVANAESILENDLPLKAQFDRMFKLKDDPRVLRCGRFLRKYSLDEFPQFFSILVGKTTFVGPRAITSDARERYGPLAPKLLSMKPGLTGFWQVMGRQTTTYEEKIQMDMFYIDHWSIWLDLVIVAKTFWEVLRAEGAY